MKKTILAATFVATILSVTAVQADHHGEPQYAALEGVFCNYKDGKGLKNVLSVADEMKEWASKNMSIDYSAWVMTPFISNSSYFDLGASFIIHNEKYLAGLSFKHLNKPNTSFNKEEKLEKPIQISIQGAYEFDLNPYERRFFPRYSYLYAYLAYTKFGEANIIYLSQDLQLGEFSFGLSQQLGSGLNGTGITNIGVSLGLAIENFDFGLLYNFPSRKPATELSAPGVFSPSIFELFITFDFSIYRRNRRGQYNRLTTDNYY